MRFIPTRRCQYRAKTQIQNADIVDWAAAMMPASTHILPAHTHVTIDHVIPREKRWELWTAVSGLLALISKAYRNFSLWHHEFHDLLGCFGQWPIASGFSSMRVGRVWISDTAYILMQSVLRYHRGGLHNSTDCSLGH